jgi:FMN reductase
MCLTGSVLRGNQQPTAIYTSGRDFIEGELFPAISARVNQAIAEAALLVKARAESVIIAAE